MLAEALAELAGGIGQLPLVVCVGKLACRPTQQPPRRKPRALSWPILQIQSYRISMTYGSNRVSERSPGKDPVLIVQQKSGTLKQINSYNEHLKVQIKVYTMGHTMIHYSFHNDFIIFYFILGRACKGRV